MYGLRQSDITSITATLRTFPEVEEALIFGSRAKGTQRQGSDVDIALKGVEIGFSTLSRISALLNEESLMPYHFDLVHYNEIENAELRDHIDRVGKQFYIRLADSRRASEPNVGY